MTNKVVLPSRIVVVRFCHSFLQLAFNLVVEQLQAHFDASFRTLDDLWHYHNVQLEGRNSGCYDVQKGLK